MPHHRGSGDIDLILSVAITKGETALYYKSLEERLSPFFEPFGSACRWRKRDEVAGIPLLVDFMGPEIEATQIADGTIQPEDETASENVGSRLRPLPLRSAGVVDADPESKLIEGSPRLSARDSCRCRDPPHRAGRFLASKADAFNTRSDTKDGYDVAWWCINSDREPEVVADQVIERPAFREEYFQESVAILIAAFRD